MKIKSLVGARGAFPLVTAGMIAVSLVTSAASAQQHAVSAAPDPEISVVTPPVTRYINFVATPNSYVVLLRISNMGAVDVLYPAIPSVDRARVKSADNVQVPTIASTPRERSASSVFAFVSSAPYDFSKVSDTNGWNSLHLSSYGGRTDALIAAEFASEIAGPDGRVIMSRATYGGDMLVVHSAGQSSAKLAAFLNRCPALQVSVVSANGTLSCIPKQFAQPVLATSPAQRGQR